MPSRKNGRFSAKKSAKRSLTVTCAASDSTWLKSGFSVASTDMLVKPRRRFAPALRSGDGRENSVALTRVPFDAPVTNGCSSVTTPRWTSLIPAICPDCARKLATRRASVHVSSRPVRCVFRRMFTPHFAPDSDGYRRLLNGMRTSTTYPSEVSRPFESNW